MVLSLIGWKQIVKVYNLVPGDYSIKDLFRYFHHGHISGGGMYSWGGATLTQAKRIKLDVVWYKTPIQYASPLQEAKDTIRAKDTIQTIQTQFGWRYHISFIKKKTQQKLAIGEEEVLDLNPFLVHFPSTLAYHFGKATLCWSVRIIAVIMVSASRISCSCHHLCNFNPDVDGLLKYQLLLSKCKTPMTIKTGQE